MQLEPPPGHVIEFNWIWSKWLFGVFAWIQFEGSIETVTANANAGDKQTILADDDTAGGAITVTLPLAEGFKRALIFKKLGTTGNIVIDGNGSQTIDGSANVTLTTQYESVSVKSSGTSWYIVGKYL